MLFFFRLFPSVVLDLAGSLFVHCSFFVCLQVWCSPEHLLRVEEAMSEVFDRVEHRVAWTTRKPRPIGDQGACIRDFEQGLAGYKSAASLGPAASRFRIRSGESPTSVYVGPATSAASQRKCPGALSAAIPYNFFQQHCHSGEWILDLMCGLGSAALAAQGCALCSVSVDINHKMVSCTLSFALFLF